MGVRRSASGGVDLKKFIERLHTVYISGTGEHPLCASLEPDQARWVPPLLSRIARAIASTSTTVVDLFEEIDTGHGTSRLCLPTNGRTVGLNTERLFWACRLSLSS